MVSMVVFISRARKSGKSFPADRLNMEKPDMRQKIHFFLPSTDLMVRRVLLLTIEAANV